MMSSIVATLRRAALLASLATPLAMLPLEAQLREPHDFLMRGGQNLAFRLGYETAIGGLELGAYVRLH